MITLNNFLPKSLEFFLQFICPLFGSLISSVLWFSFIVEIEQIKNTHLLKNKNPYRYFSIFLGGIVWGIYSFIIKDIFLSISNINAFILGLYYLLVVSNSFDLYYKFRNFIPIILSSLYFIFIIICVNNIYFENKFKVFLGYLGIIIFIWFILFPINDIIIILKTSKYEGSFNIAISSFMNCIFWSLYSYFVLNDFNIYAPNLFGCLICIIELVLSICYKKPSSLSTNEINC